MDPSSKKRKSDESGAAASQAKLTVDDARKIIESFTQEQLLGIVGDAMCGGDAGVLDAVRAIADLDPAQRKLFIRALSSDTTAEGLRVLFSAFGDLEETVVITDKATGRSKGYGFITFRHIDGALLALKEPSKKIDGRMTVAQLAVAGNAAPAPAPTADVSLRKIYVAGVPPDLPADRLLAHFSSYGEIEEGPLGFDKQTGKSKGFALFVYKTIEAARAALLDPTKMVDGHQMLCKLANEGKKGKPVAPGTGTPVGGVQGQPTRAGDDILRNGLNLGSQSLPNSLSNPYGVPGGLSSFGGYPGGGLPLGAPGLSSIGSQVPGAGGYESGPSAPYGSNSHHPGPGSGAYRELDMGSSLRRMNPSSVGMPSGGYPESRHYELPSSEYQSQHHQSVGTSTGPRVPMGGGFYQGMPPYY